MWPRCGPIPTYGIFYFAGIVSFAAVAVLLRRRMGVRWRVWVALSLAYALAMIVGAKALYDLQHGAFRVAAMFSSRHYAAGGMWGGPMVYLGLAVPLCALLGGNRRASLDLAAIALPVPLILAKVGCLCNGCCYGRACSWPWGVTYPAGGSTPSGVPLHPTQAYEILVLLVILVILLVLRRRCRSGTLLLWFLALYGCGRGLTEVWRGDLQDRGFLGPLSHSQWLCLLAVGVSVSVLLVRRGRRACQPAAEPGG